MADCKRMPLEDYSQMLVETRVGFLFRLNKRILYELRNLKDHSQFLTALLAKELAPVGHNNWGESFIKQMMALQLATILCCRGADDISNLMEAMEESGDSGIFPALLNWAKAEEKLATELREHFEKRAKIPYGLSSSGTKLIDKIMSSKEKDIIEQLECHLVESASKIANAQEFYSSLVPQDDLPEQDNNLETGQNSQVKAIEKSIRAACSTRAIGSLVIALQRTDNEHILTETFEWLQALQAKNQNSPTSVRSHSNHQDESKPLTSAFFEQPAPLDDLEKVAVLNCQPDSSTKGTFSVEFNKEIMLVYLAGGTVYLQNWRDNEEKTVEFGTKVKNITCVQYDEKICVVGTGNGTIYLFDSKSLEAKWSVRLGEPVKSLKFVELKLGVVTRGLDRDRFWCIDISRADMRLSKNWFELSGWKPDNSGIVINPDCIFVYYSDVVDFYDTESGSQMTDKNGEGFWLKAPSDISCLNVVDLVSTKDVVLTGCTNGVIAIWNDYKSMNQQSPEKTLEGHTEEIVSLCSLNGHVLSLDKSGKLLMWSGYDLENRRQIPLAPQMLSDDFCNVNCLVAHDRWFAASSSEDSSVSIWTLPDLWLRCG